MKPKPEIGRECLADSDGLLTLSDIACATGISMINLMRYSVQHASRIPSNGSISQQRRYPSSAVDVFLAIRKELSTIDSLNGLRMRPLEMLSKSDSNYPPDYLFSLEEVSKILGITLADLARYDALYDNYIPAEGAGEEKRYPECSFPYFKTIQRKDAESNSPTEEERPLAVFEWVSPELWHALSTNPELLRSLHWREFEKVLAGLLEKLEYEIELQRGTKDGGVDIFAIKRVTPFGLHRYLIQAKRSAAAIGVAPVRQLMFLHSEHRVSKSCLATTSRFTRGAWAVASAYQWQLELRDFDMLKEWVQALENRKAPNSTLAADGWRRR